MKKHTFWFRGQWSEIKKSTFSQNEANEYRLMMEQLPNAKITVDDFKTEVLVICMWGNPE